MESSPGPSAVPARPTAQAGRPEPPVDSGRGGDRGRGADVLRAGPGARRQPRPAWLRPPAHPPALAGNRRAPGRTGTAPAVAAQKAVPRLRRDRRRVLRSAGSGSLAARRRRPADRPLQPGAARTAPATARGLRRRRRRPGAGRRPAGTRSARPGRAVLPVQHHHRGGRARSGGTDPARPARRPARPRDPPGDRTRPAQQAGRRRRTHPGGPRDARHRRPQPLRHHHARRRWRVRERPLPGTRQTGPAAHR